jgi:hypothetical protein
MLGMVRQGKSNYYFRLRIPKDVSGYFPCRELKKSLRTTRYKQAKALVVNLLSESEKLFTMIRSKALTEQMVLKLAQDFLDAIPTLPRITFPMPSMC